MIATAIPGASFVITALVASGVTSLSEKPVPPVVKIRSSFMTSAHITRTSRFSTAPILRDCGHLCPSLLTENICRSL
uniref:Putative secreted protein n=1 Tax=Ixodes ricinus TaxID=34613 RepID=A0A6B0U374_IXORI